jgi:CheY-like chemotaxis protein
MMVGKVGPEEDRSMPPLKLLVVEDDLAGLELMTEVFTSLKAEVRPLSESQKAVALVNQEKFDGIFLDLEMPMLNGFNLARLIRKSSWNKSTPIVIVTGRDGRSMLPASNAVGGCKPRAAEILGVGRATISQILSRMKLLEGNETA